MPEVSILFSVQDNMSQKLTTIRNAMKPFRKDLEALGRAVEALNKKKAVVKVDVESAKKAMEDARKQFKKTGEEVARQNHIAKQMNFDHARQSYTALSESAKNAEKQLAAAQRAMSRADNRAGLAGPKKRTEEAAVGKSFNKEIFKELGNSIFGLAKVGVSSALGEPAGNMVSSLLSGALSGAVMGSAAGPAGIAVGAIAGTITGGIQAVTQKFESEDAALQSAVQGQYDTVTQQQGASLESGKGLAAQREMDEITFSKLIKGEMTSGEYLGQVKTMANNTPFLYQDLTSMSKDLAPALGDNPQKMLEWITNIGDAGAGMGLGTSEMSSLAKSLGSLKTTEKASMKSIDPLIDQGIHVFEYLMGNFKDEKTGKPLETKDQLVEAISKGQLDGADIAEAISQGLHGEFKGMMDQQSQTYLGLSSTQQGLQEDIDAAMGQGYTETRKSGLKDQIEWLGGDSGDKMKDVYGKIGSYKASMENEREKSMREAFDQAMISDDYKIAMAADDRSEMGRILAQAQVDAEAQYRNSKGYSIELETQKNMVRGIRDTLATEEVYKNFGYEMGIEFSKGLAAAAPEIQKKLEALNSSNPFVRSLAPLGGYGGGIGFPTSFQLEPPKLTGLEAPELKEIVLSPKAFGMRYIPYDNFPAMLHQGERVLTASEARQSDRGAGGPVININGTVVREEADLDKLARRIISEIVAAQRVTSFV